MNKCWWGVKLAASCALALMLGLVFSGEASGAFVDCGMCHMDPAPGSGTPDYVEFFVYPDRQHPTGIVYPAQDPSYIPPTALGSEVSFFDTNGNGIPDVDEVQLFGAGHKVECASCHREHGDAPPPPRPNMYLRVGTQLCSVCHRL